MRKLVAFVLLLCLLVTTAFVVSAEEQSFSVRGITFGDSSETVMSKVPGGEMYGNEYIVGTTLGDEPVEMRIEFSDNSVSRIRYRFDNGSVDHRLNRMLGMKDSYSGADSKNEFDSLYTLLSNSLIDKYGNPLGNRYGETYLVFDNDSVEFIYRDSDKTIKQYDEWVVKCEDKYVKIDLLFGEGYDDSGYYYGIIIVSYNEFTENTIDEYQKRVDKEEEKKREVQQNVTNSL